MKGRERNKMTEIEP